MEEEDIMSQDKEAVVEKVAEQLNDDQRELLGELTKRPMLFLKYNNVNGRLLRRLCSDCRKKHLLKKWVGLKSWKDAYCNYCQKRCAKEISKINEIFGRLSK